MYIYLLQVKAVIAEEMAGPKQHLKFYDKFNDLISRKVIYWMTCLLFFFSSSNRTSSRSWKQNLLVILVIAKHWTLWENIIRTVVRNQNKCLCIFYDSGRSESNLFLFWHFLRLKLMWINSCWKDTSFLDLQKYVSKIHLY